MPKTYTIKANRTPQDVLKNNDITIGHADTLEEAWRISLLHQRAQEFCCVWIEEEKKPRVERKIESDRTGVKFTAVYCDGWAI